MSYLMESKSEADRLLMKSDEESTRAQLLLTGLKPGMKALDAGGGAGFVTKIMDAIVGPSGSVTIADRSDDRLKVARHHAGSEPTVHFLSCDLEAIPAKDNSFDYVFCRFVFEYLRDPQAVFNELKRVTKRGGRLVIGDLDNNLLSHFPLDRTLESQLKDVVHKLESLKIWDPYAGRKIYNYYYRGGVSDVKVHMIAHHLFYGTVRNEDVRNWEAKIDQIKKLAQGGSIQVEFEIDQFKESFMKFFKDPGRFSYSPLILVEGVKG